MVCAGLFAAGVVCVLSIRADTRPLPEPGRSRAAQIREGLGYVWKNKLVLGAVSLDLFAVLLGGATGLLPVFARDVLGVGPQGFGLLRASPAVGACGGRLPRPPADPRPGGVKMLLAVGLFGLMTVVFAYSRSVPLSMVALAVLGGADMVSVFTRQTLVQLATPDRMRGRVSAVSTLFIGASNELGEFESGVVARFLGPVGAVAFGGAGAMAVTAAVGLAVPSAAEGGPAGVSPSRRAISFAPFPPPAPWPATTSTLDPNARPSATRFAVVRRRPDNTSPGGDSHSVATARPCPHVASILATSTAIRSSLAEACCTRTR